MMHITRFAAAAALLLAAFQPVANADAPQTSALPAPEPAAPGLVYAFSVRVTLAPPVEVGEADGGRRRFIPITGGEVYGPRLHGAVLPGGGDWQTILPGGLTRIEARYFLKADDGSVIEVTNPGVRVASAEVTQRLAKGEQVDPTQYYFRTAPVFKTGSTAQGWVQRAVFVGRGIRRPDSVVIDYYEVH
jgi:hypothetical protein